jgi:adenosylmethionine-8-amino-7-oxononanoate aminotransferase
MPLGVTMATQAIFDAFYVDPNAHAGRDIHKTFFHGHTFTGHPLACAVALASLDLFEKNHLLDHVQTLTPIMDELLLPLRAHPHVADVRRLGLIAAIDLVARKHPRTPFPFHWRIGGALCTQMRSRGVLLRPLADTLIVMPPLAIRAENLRHLCATVVQSMDGLPDLLAKKQAESPPPND